jgi:hypothetical protein
MGGYDGVEAGVLLPVESSLVIEALRVGHQQRGGPVSLRLAGVMAMVRGSGAGYSYLQLPRFCRGEVETL